MPAQIRIEKSDNVTKRQKDWLGCHGNTWAPVKVMPGTCELCAFGRGKHIESCTRYESKPESHIAWLDRNLNRYGGDGGADARMRRAQAAIKAKEEFLKAARELNQRGIL